MAMLIEKDLRAYFGPARDQDPRPTCMAFAASDAHASVRPGWQPLSAEWAYFHALKRDGGVPHQAATMSGMLESIRVDGQPKESSWPYIPAFFADIDVWKPPAAKSLFRCGSSPQAATVGTIVDCLDACEPVLFTMSISTSFYTPNDDGVIAAIEPLEPRRLHALIAVGYGHDDGQAFILVRNSWGEGWGIGGYGWLASGYVEPRLLCAATMGIGI